MIVKKMDDMHRGWFIGDFEPSVLRTKDFEVAVLHHPAGEQWPAHYHKLGTEYNVLIEGHMNVCGQDLNPGDIFIIEPGEVADPIFHKDCTIVCVKTPSDPKDEYVIQ